jgi:hypothetical protein
MTIFKHAAMGAVALLLAGSPALAQTATDPTNTLPETSTIPDANAQRAPGTLPPGVADPTTTNSTTGTADQEDHCQPPGTAANSNPTAETVTIPRAGPACN